MFKKIFLPALLLCLQGNLFAQQTDTLIRYIDFEEKPAPAEAAIYYMKVYKAKQGDSLYQREVYSKYENNPVHSKGTTKDAAGFIKQGYFEVFYDEGNKSSTGFYNNNQKTGEWKLYYKMGWPQAIYHYANNKMTGINLVWYEDGKILDSFMLDNNGNGPGTGYYTDGNIRYKGNFVNGEKSGKWEYFYKSEPHTKSMEAVFEKDSAINTTCYTEKGEIQTKDCAYEREAEFKRGSEGWKKYLISRLENFDNYKYLGPKRKYTAIVKFIITTEGKTSNILVENPRIKALDEFAKDVIAKSPAWIPAIQYNQKVNAYRRQPITYVTD